MKTNFLRFASIAAMATGVLSILYAIFYLFISKSPADTGRLISWLILGLSGILTSAAYVGLFQRTRGTNEGLALWGLVLGIGQSVFTLTNAVQQALLINGVQNGTIPQAAFDAARLLPQSGDPSGVWAFLMFAISSVVFGRLILQTPTLPRPLGYIAWFNAVLLTLLFIGNITGTPLLIYAAGGLTSVIVTPLWWIWAGRAIAKESASEMGTQPMHPAMNMQGASK